MFGTLKLCTWSEHLAHFILIPLLPRIHSWLSTHAPEKRDKKLKHIQNLLFNSEEFFFLIKAEWNDSSLARAEGQVNW